MDVFFIALMCSIVLIAGVLGCCLFYHLVYVHKMAKVAVATDNSEMSVARMKAILAKIPKERKRKRPKAEENPLLDNTTSSPPENDIESNTPLDSTYNHMTLPPLPPSGSPSTSRYVPVEADTPDLDITVKGSYFDKEPDNKTENKTPILGPRKASFGKGMGSRQNSILKRGTDGMQRSNSVYSNMSAVCSPGVPASRGGTPSPTPGAPSVYRSGSPTYRTVSPKPTPPPQRSRGGSVSITPPRRYSVAKEIDPLDEAVLNSTVTGAGNGTPSGYRIAAPVASPQFVDLDF